MRLSLALAVAALLAAPAAPVLAQAGPNLTGNWVNPHHSVVVRIAQCGDRLCGTVVRATPEAAADARDGGYPSLVGLQLLSGYRAVGQGRWQGRVLVPDLGRTFASHIDMTDANHVKVAGCLVGQYLCKSQIWQRD